MREFKDSISGDSKPDVAAAEIDEKPVIKTD
jgi:hypothetical protein